ncbi:MAG: putative peptidase [Deltaproteobacteria bacterium ADurb.Bin510]|nr:MAG: putative peptidase [Deltaproteobacteria bacterium ADurb.Bin510]
MTERLTRARSFLKGLDGLLFVERLNLRYLSGFTGTEAMLLVTAHDAVMFTDSRYTLQAREQLDGAIRVIEVHDRWRDVYTELQKLEVGMLGVESDTMDFDTYLKLKNLFKGIQLTPLGAQLKQLRQIKDERELASMRRAARIAETALEAVLAGGLIGRSEAEVALDLEWRMRTAGASAASFDIIVASGPRAAMPHGVAGPRLIGPNEAVIIDWGCVLDGYASDETVTLFTGEPDDDFAKAYELVHAAQQRAIAGLKPGVSAKAVDALARGYLKQAGLGDYFGHGLGHGVGLNVHEAPTVSPVSEDVLAPGMVVTIEPGVYLPGRFGIRIEDTLVVTDSACQPITNLAKTAIRKIN